MCNHDYPDREPAAPATASTSERQALSPEILATMANEAIRLASAPIDTNGHGDYISMT